MTPPIRGGFIDGLSLALAHRRNPERRFVIFTAYFDESGTHEGSPITVMAAVLGSAAGWRRFESKFRKVKRKHGFQTFHTKKFKKLQGDFKGWSPAQGLALVEDMQVVTRDAFHDGVSMTLDNEAYERDYLAGEKPRKVRLDSKYGLCFRECIFHFMREELDSNKPKPTPLHIVLEAGHPNAGDAVRIFNELRAEFKGTDLDILKTITLAGKEDCDPLMMADFIAHATYSQEVAFRNGAPKPRGLLDERPGTKRETVAHMHYAPGGLAGVKERLIAKRQRPRFNASVAG